MPRPAQLSLRNCRPDNLMPFTTVIPLQRSKNTSAILPEHQRITARTPAQYCPYTTVTPTKNTPGLPPGGALLGVRSRYGRTQLLGKYL